MRYSLRGAALGVVMVVLPLCEPTAVNASEIVNYSYDAQGRLIDAVHSSGPNSGLDIQYQYDLVGNRTTQTVTGSKNAGQQAVVTPMGAGFSVTPINP